MTEPLACWACGGPTGPALYLEPLAYVECFDCGLAFRPRIESDDVREIYEDPASYEAERADQQMGKGFQERRRDARVRLGYLERYAANGRGKLFDVGAAGGAFLAEARDRGWVVAGVEPMPGAAAHARDELGLDVATGVAEDLELPPDSLDAVTMWHVLEHIPEPLGVLEELRAWIRPTGFLALEVPNGGSPAARKLGKDWPSAEPDVHVSQFTPKALRRLLERAGFHVADVSTTTIVPFYTWSQRLRPRTLAHVAGNAVAARTVRQQHPSAHELLRAVARPRD
jgi:2-polyprenyl-3-methyl-5-hydroxy-6-metoxy-1,4-benzoquinol methylase